MPGVNRLVHLAVPGGEPSRSLAGPSPQTQLTHQPPEGVQVQSQAAPRLRGDLGSVKTEIERLHKAGFYASESLVSEILRAAGE